MMPVYSNPAMAAWQHRCFNLGRHVPVDGEHAVEVESHDAAIHDASEG